MATLCVKNFPDELHDWLKACAAERGISIRALVIEIVKQALRTEQVAERSQNR